MDYNSLSAYNMLQVFSQLQSHSSFDKSAPTWTPRLFLLKDILDSFSIKYKIKHYIVPGYESRYFTNIYVSLNTENTEEGLLFLAHHDINNPKSENCQDNTSSICHLLEMIKELKDKQLKRPIHFAFVDSEEHVNLHCCGSQVLSEDIHNGEFGNLEVCINLELTGLGKHIWVSSFERFPESCSKSIEHLNAIKVITPYNDAYVLSIHDVPAMCIGILDDSDIDIATNSYGYPSIWALCHSIEDSFDKISEEDMNLFHKKLLGLCL
jgi:hypothetical protein